MSEYVGQPAKQLPGDTWEVRDSLTTGKWCIWKCRAGERWFWWCAPRYDMAWKSRETAEAHYKSSVQNLRPGERCALIDSAGVVRAYDEMSIYAYVGQPASQLPDGGFHEHEPGRWCLAMWERRTWESAIRGRSVRSWKQRATAVKRFREVAAKLHPGERLAMVDGTGLVRAYAELGTKEMAAMLQQLDWVRLGQKHPEVVAEVYRCLRVRALGVAI